jgi:hypothetical protein
LVLPLKPARVRMRWRQIIKNSWSENFANAGYIKVARGVKCASMCSSAGICGHLFTAGDPSLYYEGPDDQ